MTEQQILKEHLIEKFHNIINASAIEFGYQVCVETGTNEFGWPFARYDWDKDELECSGDFFNYWIDTLEAKLPSMSIEEIEAEIEAFKNSEEYFEDPIENRPW